MADTKFMIDLPQQSLLVIFSMAPLVSIPKSASVFNHSVLREAVPLVASLFAAAGQTEVWRHQRRGEGAPGFGLAWGFGCFGLELPPMGQGAVQHVLRVMVALWLCVPCRLRGPTTHMF